MNVKHTPGPWIAKSTGSGGFEILDRPDCWEAVVLCARYPWGERRDEMVANARLIAAAPDLLASLKALVDDMSERFDLDSPSTNPGIKSTIADGRAAISKATGEPA